MRLEWLILADAAQNVGGKLFLLGGGWETLMVNTVPVQQQMALAIAFDVTWNETNERHPFQILIQDQDGAELAKVEGEFEVGRPPGIPPGQSQRFQMAAPATLSFQAYGTYVIKVLLRGEEVGSIRFHVVQNPLFAITQQRKEGPPKDEGKP